MKISKSKISIPSRKIVKVTKKTKLNKLLEQKPDSAEILFEAGMGCACCPMAMQETLEDGCKAHGMNKEEVDKLIKNLNK